MNNCIEIKITQSDLDRLHAHIYQEVSFEIDWETSPVAADVLICADTAPQVKPSFAKPCYKVFYAE